MFSESSPSCSSTTSINIVEVNKCGSGTETVNISCTVSFNGNISPAIKWRDSSNWITDGTDTIDVASNVTRITSSMVLPVSSIKHGTNFVCELVNTAHQHPKYSCETEAMKVFGKLSEHVYHMKLFLHN